ncbi:MAG: 6-phosphofructokinase [Eubacteriales bacterium]|nr:6-phosphofructokinase [Eubacteriales bacterium]
MEILYGNAIFGQSGGPTSVINASAAGVFIEALAHSDVIGKVYGAAHGIKGILAEEIYDIGQEDPCELELLKTTPSSALGSCRYKLKDATVDETDYLRLLEVFRKYNIRYFFYNGGNDSMDTCNKISKYMQKADWECRVMGVPKTIDNDLFGTDHCPGFASSAKYIATSTMEVYLDSKVYDFGMVTVIELMGRNAGWLTAATAISASKGLGPDLIYLPEIPFDLDQMMSDVRKIYERDNKCLIAVSEGVKSTDGRYIPELVGTVARDAFGHAQLGGTASILSSYIGERLGCKVRGIEFSLLQRCAAHLASKTDVDESYLAGQTAVKSALDGMTDYMVGFERKSTDPYVCEIKLIPLDQVANTEKKIPLDWINSEGNGLLPAFLDYVMPLIAGESSPPMIDGVPRFSSLKKVKAVI